MKFGCHQFVLPAALSAVLLVSCSPSEKPKVARPDAAPRNVRIARAELRPMERTLRVVGTLSAHAEATVAAQVAGQIETNHVDLGDHVAAGQELTLIDTTSYEARARQAAAVLAKATAAAASAAQDLKRIQDLQKDNIASTADLDQAVAEAGKTAADVKAAEAAAAIARLDLERSRVRSPFAGSIAQRLVNAGDYVGVGTPMMRLVKTDPLRLRLEVPERESMAVRVGQVVRLSAEGDTNIYRGQIARVAPAIRDADRMLLVEADVPNPGTLRVGLFANAQIVLQENESVVSVPGKALLIFAGIEKIVTLKDGKAAEKTVTAGRRNGDWVEIVSGLAPGEPVVLEPGGIRTGQPLIESDANAGPAAQGNGGSKR